MKLLPIIGAAVLALASVAHAQSDAGPADAGAAADVDVDAGGIVIPDHMVPRPDAPEAIAGIANGTVQVGRAFSLFVTITHEPGVEVNVPSAIVGGGAFDELRRTYTDSTRPDGRKVREYEIQLMAWVVGDHMLPPIEVIYVVRGEAHRTETAPVPVSVVGVIGEGEEKLRDIAPPVGVERADYTLLYIGAAVVGVLIVAVVLLIWARRRSPRTGRKRVVAAGPELPLAPGPRALARLERLRESGALEAEDRKPGYLELSEIVREYLASRFRFNALDSTTSEIKAHLGRRADGGPAMDILDGWLDEVDLVKYASYQPEADETERALADAQTLIERCESAPVIDGAPAVVEPPAPVAAAAAAADAPTERTATVPADPGDDGDAGDTFRGMPAAGRGRSRWEPPADYLVADPRVTDTVRTPTLDPEPDTVRDPEPEAGEHA